MTEIAIGGHLTPIDGQCSSLKIIFITNDVIRGGCANEIIYGGCTNELIDDGR